MELKITPLKCTGCGACEIACSMYQDETNSTMVSSIILHREEKKNYFGIMIKTQKDVYLARPEGPEWLSQSEGASGPKPILLRPPCDGCKNREDKLCVKFCPSGSIEEGFTEEAG
jgi:Fe-S-cluster-containing hydrogenase component 2